MAPSVELLLRLLLWLLLVLHWLLVGMRAVLTFATTSTNESVTSCYKIPYADIILIVLILESYLCTIICKQLSLYFLYHPTCCPWQGSGIMLLVSLSMGIEMSIARIIWVSGCVSIATLLHSGRMTIASSISSVVGNSIDVTLRRGATILGMGRDTVMVDDSGSGGGGITVVVGSCVVTDVVASCCWEARVASTRSNWGVIAGR